MVAALIPERERQDGQHDKQHAHSDILARAAQAMITKSATVLTAGTSIGATRFLGQRGGVNPNGGHFLLRPVKSPQNLDGGADAVSVLGRRAVRADEDVVGRLRTRA